MKRKKREIFYDIKVPGKMYIKNGIGWTSDYNGYDDEYTRQRVYSIRKLIKACTFLPSGTVIIKHSVHNGKRVYCEWELR